MMPRISLVFAALAVAQSVDAWTFVWRNAKGESSVEWGNKAQDCKDIDHGEGEHFSWDPKDSGLCILMYSDDKCTSSVIGRSCPVWAKDSSGDISAFQVVDADYTKSDSMKSTTTAASTTSATSMVTTTTSAPTTETTAGSTSEPTATPAPEDRGMSGGAIAGIVIGVIALIVLLGLIGWIVFRRHQRNSTRPKSLGPSSFAGATPAVKISSIPDQPPGPPKSAGGSQYGPESPSAYKWGGPSSPSDLEPSPAPYTTRPPPGTHLVELSDTSQLVELDGGSRR